MKWSSIWKSLTFAGWKRPWWWSQFWIAVVSGFIGFTIVMSLDYLINSLDLNDPYTLVMIERFLFILLLIVGGYWTYNTMKENLQWIKLVLQGLESQIESMEDQVTALRAKVDGLIEPKPPATLMFRFGVPRLKTGESETHMPVQITIPATHEIHVTINDPIDKYGNDAPIDGEPVWTSNSPMLEVREDPDPNVEGGKILYPTGQTGSFRVTVTGDADLGEGVEEISDYIDVLVVAGKATGFGFNMGTPHPKEDEEAPEPE